MPDDGVWVINLESSGGSERSEADHANRGAADAFEQGAHCYYG